MRSPASFTFMHWAKQWVGRTPYCLGASGVPAVSPEDLPPAPAPYAGPNYYGTDAVRAAVAAMQEVAPDGVLISEGTSLANYTALTVLAGPGDRILVETPTYPVLREIPRFHGARVEPLARRPENAWLPSLDEIRAAASGDGPLRAVVLTRLHNPTGADLPGPFLEELDRLAHVHDFHVLLDEVYLDFVDRPRGHRISKRFVTTGSLTKVYGFGGIRVGWVVGDPDVLAPMKELSFYLAVDGSTLSQATAVRVLADRRRFLDRARRLAAQVDIVDEWIRTRDDVEWTRPAGGINAFLRFPRVPDTARFAAELREHRGVNVAEGEWFGLPGWARVSFGGAEETLREGLKRLGEALDELPAR